MTTQTLFELVSEFKRRNYGKAPKFILMGMSAFDEIREDFLRQVTSGPINPPYTFMGIKIIPTEYISINEVHLLTD